MYGIFLNNFFLNHKNIIDNEKEFHHKHKYPEFNYDISCFLSNRSLFYIKTFFCMFISVVNEKIRQNTSQHRATSSIFIIFQLLLRCNYF